MGGCHLRLPFDLCDHCISKDEEARLFLQISRAEGGRVSIAIEDDDNVDISSRCHITSGAGFSVITTTLHPTYRGRALR